VAAEAATHYQGFTDHPFPSCYVCGPLRPDGLKIFPGKMADGRTAAPWVVPDDVVAPTIWAALDCPGGWAAITAEHKYVLGRITAYLGELPKPGDTCVVTGQCTRVVRRKANVRSAVYASDGTLVGRAEAIWIMI
jgi:hypothetical protein